MALAATVQQVDNRESPRFWVRAYEDATDARLPLVQAFILVDTNGNPISPSAISTPSTIGNGSKTVAVSGTAEALAASTTCKRVDIVAEDDNTGKIWIGGATIDQAAKNGKYIFAAQGYTIEIDDLAKIFIDADVSGDGVSFTYYA